MKKLMGISILIIVVIMLIVGVMGFMSVGQTETAAKKDLEKYLALMQKGDQDTAENFLSFGVDNLIDVFNYKYLSTLDENDLPVTNTMTFEAYNNSEYIKKEYPTWKQYKNFIKNTFGNVEGYVIEDNRSEITYYKEGETFKEYTFLYNMEIANGGGEKIYKKVEFTLEWTDNRWNGEDFEEGFEITDITIR
jgi:hypothetical protein